MCAVLFPEPAFVAKGDNITFYTPETLKVPCALICLNGGQAELSRNPKCIYVIEFFANWSPECRRVTPHFAQISNMFVLRSLHAWIARFSSHKLKFGKLDVGRYAQASEIEFRINTAVNSRQLPTIALFRQVRPPNYRKNDSAELCNILT